LIKRNPKVIFINIFGGITRCDDVANAVADVYKEKGIPVPLVIRLVGTNQDIGRAILKEIGIEAYDFMMDAAKKAVEICQGSSVEYILSKLAGKRRKKFLTRRSS